MFHKYMFLLQISCTHPDIHILHLHGISSVSETDLCCQSKSHGTMICVDLSLISKKSFCTFLSS